MHTKLTQLILVQRGIFRHVPLKLLADGDQRFFLPRQHLLPLLQSGLKMILLILELCHVRVVGLEGGVELFAEFGCFCLCNFSFGSGVDKIFCLGGVY